MERQKYIFRALALILSLSMSFSIYSQPKYAQAIYDAYVKGEMDKWSQVISDMESENRTTVNDKLELIEYYYG